MVVALRWTLVGTMLATFVAFASCSGDDPKKKARPEDAGGAGGDAAPASAGAGASDGATGGTGDSPSSGGNAEGGAITAPEGGTTGVGPAGASSGGALSSAGDGGQGGGGPACCTGDYQSSSLLLPDAACSAWKRFGLEPANPSTTGNYLRISTAANLQNSLFFEAAPELAMGQTFTIEVRMRLISGTSGAASVAPAYVAFMHGGTEQTNTLFFADGEIFVLAAENVKGTAATVATTDDFHTYTLVVDTEAGNLEVFYDGGSVLTADTFLQPGDVDDYIGFGEGTSGAYGVSDWQYVTHDAAACGN